MTIRLGIVGTGGFARKHLAALERLRGRARVVMLARRHPDRPVDFPEAAGIPVASAEDLLAADGIDAVLVCSPNHLHRAQAEAALRAGKHVFCEKPLALSVSDADAVLDAAVGTGRVLMVGHLTRHTAAYAAVADLLESGRMGTVAAMHASRLQVAGNAGAWRMRPELGGGAAFDLLLHDFDLMHWYLGAPRMVFASGTPHPHGAFDYLSAVFSFRCGAVATVEGGFRLRPPSSFRATLRLLCEHGHIEVDTAAPDAPVLVFHAGEPVEALSLDPVRGHARGIESELEEFLDAVEGRRPTRLKTEDARVAVMCAAQAVASGQTGRALGF